MKVLWENIFKKGANDDIFDSLKRNIIFRDLSANELKFVTNIIHIREYRPGERVFSQGEVGVGMYVIIKGSIDIIVEEYSRHSNEDKKEVHITRLGEGDFFGELSLIEDNGRRNASAISDEETQLIGFFKPDLMEILERNPQIGSKIVFRLAEVLGKRLIKTTENVTQLRKELQNVADVVQEPNAN